ncbi:MAG: M18 family aminopeptidase [Velocimicrobium sp.]
MNEIKELLAFIKEATSPFHVVLQSEAMLKAAGFEALIFDEPWELQQGNSYFTKVHDTTLFAFTIGKHLSDSHTFRIASAHTDHPCLHIKPNAEYTQNDYLRVNVELYGGMTKNTWLDRPLSIAGKIALKSEDVFHPNTILLDCKRPLLTIPNIAIHMNHDLNKGVELNNQIEMIPLLGTMNETLNKDHYFLDFLAQELNVASEDILDFDLYIYSQDDGCELGLSNDFVSAPRLDNLTSVFACTKGIITGNNENTINIIALFDNEEIGSHTKQGADSIISNLLLEKIYLGLFQSNAGLYNTILKSHMISVDVAHGYHPNYPGKNDPTNVTLLNKGISLKINSNQKYATDSEAIAILQQLCTTYAIPYQKYVNRSDISGGQTLGPLSSSWLPMKTVDLGVPLLAMHSARELMGAKDQASLNKLIVSFFSA